MIKFYQILQALVLPSLREKHDEFMLRELVKRWLNHKIMVRWFSRFFHYLDRYFIARRSLPPLREVGLTCFRDLVYQELSVKARDAVISLVDQEREGEQIDRALLKNVLDIFVEIGMGMMDYYDKDFEDAMLKDTAAYYSRKASNWILEDSCPDYMLKAEECLKREKDRVSHYLHSSSEAKLLEKVQHELLSVYATQLLEKEHSGCHALLRDDKHVTAEGSALVKQAEDAASNKKADKKDVIGLQEQVFVRKVIELHDKFMAYVNDCFVNHTCRAEIQREETEKMAVRNLASKFPFLKRLRPYPTLFSPLQSHSHFIFQTPRGIPLAVGDCVHSEIGGQRCNLGGVSGFHSGRVLRNVEPEVERGDGPGQVPVMKRKKLKGKRAVVRWLKLFRWKKKKAFERMTAEEKILDKLRKARRKEERLVEALRKIEPNETSETAHDPEILTPEELFYFLKMGEKCKNYVPVGRRGIYQGVILNMHLH